MFTGEEIAVALVELFGDNRNMLEEIINFMEHLMSPEEKCYDGDDDDEEW